MVEVGALPVRIEDVPRTPCLPRGPAIEAHRIRRGRPCLGEQAGRGRRARATPPRLRRGADGRAEGGRRMACRHRGARERVVALPHHDRGAIRASRRARDRTPICPQALWIRGSICGRGFCERVDARPAHDAWSELARRIADGSTSPGTWAGARSKGPAWSSASAPARTPRTPCDRGDVPAEPLRADRATFCPKRRRCSTWNGR